MSENQNAFDFSEPSTNEDEYSDVQTDPESRSENQPRPDIRSFADTTGMHYFVILRPNSYNLNHKLQLITLKLDDNGKPETFIKK